MLVATRLASGAAAPLHARARAAALLRLMRPHRVATFAASSRHEPLTLSSASVTSGEREIVFETGKLAHLADGAVTARCRETVVLVTAVAAPGAADGADFFPLQVDVREKQFASGRIPTTRSRREMGTTDDEVLSGRVIDRSIRPLFPSSYMNETQLVATLLATDGVGDQDVLGINAASAALLTSAIPFDGPVAAVRVGLVNGTFVVNPTSDQLDASALDLLYAGTASRTVMIEAEAREVPEAQFIDALRFAHRHVQPLLAPQLELARLRGGRPKMPHRGVLDSREGELWTARELAYEAARRLFADSSHSKHSRGEAVTQLVQQTASRLTERFPYLSHAAGKELASHVIHVAVRDNLLGGPEGGDCVRCDGRGQDELRFLQSEVGTLPVVHGSSFFARGDTAALCTITLGPHDPHLDGTDALGNFMLHYEFPPYCVNEVGKVGGVNRRMVGHGNLAMKALRAVLPRAYPFTVRITSEITGSDGSSSMATVCGATLALMDAGVPISAPVAGISVGLVTDGDPLRPPAEVSRSKLLTDIMGLEDHYGDMDFKVAGTHRGVTAVQLDVKLPGVPLDILCEGVQRATRARRQLLDHMSTTIPQPRQGGLGHSPRMITVPVALEERGAFFGAGRSNLFALEEMGASVTVTPDGFAHVFSPAEAYERVQEFVSMISERPAVGSVVRARVKEVREFGFVLEAGLGKQGMLHNSELSHQFVADRAGLLKLGDIVQVKVIDIDSTGKPRFSKKALEPPPARATPAPPTTDGPSPASMPIRPPGRKPRVVFRGPAAPEDGGSGGEK